MQNKQLADNELSKKESKSSIVHDKNHRDNIRSKLEMSVNVFDFNLRPVTNLIKFATGKV